LASSAAGFAAIAFGLGKIGQLDEKAVVKLARIGSGSACRSVLGGFVHWIAGSRLDSDEETTCKVLFWFD
jgi:diphosphomevalonate decarboxylase